MKTINKHTLYGKPEVNGTDRSIIEVFQSPDTHVRSGVAHFNAFLLVLEGACTGRYDAHPSFEVKSREFIFLPYGLSYEFTLSQGCTMVIIRVPFRNQLYKRYDFHALYEENEKKALPDIVVLPVRNLMNLYLEGLISYLPEMSYQSFYEVKVDEFFFLLEECYTPKELAGLFKSLFIKDFDFVDFVFGNWSEKKDVHQLAELSGYDEKTFNHKFEEVFGMPAVEWLQRNKVKK